MRGIFWAYLAALSVQLACSRSLHGDTLKNDHNAAGDNDEVFFKIISVKHETEDGSDKGAKGSEFEFLLFGNLNDLNKYRIDQENDKEGNEQNNDSIKDSLFLFRNTKEITPEILFNKYNKDNIYAIKLNKQNYIVNNNDDAKPDNKLQGKDNIVYFIEENDGEDSRQTIFENSKVNEALFEVNQNDASDVKLQQQNEAEKLDNIDLYDDSEEDYQNEENNEEENENDSDTFGEDQYDDYSEEDKKEIKEDDADDEDYEHERLYDEDEKYYKDENNDYSNSVENIGNGKYEGFWLRDIWNK